VQPGGEGIPLLVWRGGQLAWVDPASGISLAYLTSAHDRNEVRQGRRGVSISNRAADLAA